MLNQPISREYRISQSVARLTYVSLEENDCAYGVNSRRNTTVLRDVESANQQRVLNRSISDDGYKYSGSSNFNSFVSVSRPY